MKIKLNNNAELVIQANMNKSGDYDKVVKIAEKMVEDSCGMIDIASVEEAEGWIHLCAVWNHYQAGDLKAAYQVAKGEVK